MSNLDIPIDVPSYPFARQLEIVAKWAHLDPALLLDNQAKIAATFKNSPEAVKTLLECCPKTPWDWPAYASHIAKKLAEDEDEYDDPEDAPTADDVREFHRDELKDRVEHLYGKLRSNFYALYRKSQIDELKEFRPFWQIKGDCSDPLNRDVIRTRHADDGAWAGERVPWSCDKLLCRCDVYALSPRELARYVESNGKNDLSAINLLREWEEKEAKNPPAFSVEVRWVDKAE